MYHGTVTYGDGEATDFTGYGNYARLQSVEHAKARFGLGLDSVLDYDLQVRSWSRGEPGRRSPVDWGRKLLAALVRLVYWVDTVAELNERLWAIVRDRMTREGASGNGRESTVRTSEVWKAVDDIKGSRRENGELRQIHTVDE